MRLIPVIDLLDGQAVHAIKGDRGRYLPVRSALCDTPDPMMIARAFRDRLGLREVYIADLNAIQGKSPAGHRDCIASLACSEGLDVILDAGISSVAGALAWLSLGVRKAIIGAETLDQLSALQQFPERIGPNRLIFSLDMRAGRILTRCPELNVLPPIEALSLISQSGWLEVILLDIDRVGSERGIDISLLAKARAGFPDLNILVGGGVANPEQLLELKSMGIEGVLAATALHRGTVTAQHIPMLIDERLD